jgi:hypothetical protein
LNQEHKSFAPENTLILFNITGLERIDIMVPKDHPHINDGCSWARLFDFAWLTSMGWFGSDHVSPIGILSGHSKPLLDSLQKNQGYEQVVLSNCLSIVNFIESLKAKRYRFCFMIMDDRILEDSPKWFRDFLEAQDASWIRFGEYLSMLSYTKSLKNHLQEDNFHPNHEGSKAIAKVAANSIDHYFTPIQVLETGENKQCM